MRYQRASVRMQAFIHTAIQESRPDSQMVYGPLSVGFEREGCWFRVAGKWKPGVREPLQSMSILKPAATCSPFVSLFCGYWLAANEDFNPIWGRGTYRYMMTRRIREGGAQEYLRPLWPKRNGGKRLVKWSHILENQGELPLVSIARHTVSKPYPSHVVLLLRCGAGGLMVSDPRTGEALNGLYVLAADGWMRKRRSNGRTSWIGYSATPLTLEPAEERLTRLRKADVWALPNPDVDGHIPGYWEDNELPTLSVAGDSDEMELLEEALSPLRWLQKWIGMRF